MQRSRHQNDKETFNMHSYRAIKFNVSGKYT